MKKYFFSAMLILSAFSIIISCKKDKKEDTTLSTDVQQQNTDANNYKAESDQADNDINNSLKEIPAFGKVAGVASSPLCGVTIDSSHIAQKILFFNFDGTTFCFVPTRTRSGQIKVQLTSGDYWRDANAVLTITYNNFKITRSSDGASIMFNGVKTLQNIYGNNWITFLTGTGTFKYRERAFNINVTFNNGSTAVWNSARTTEWSYIPAPNPANAKFVFTATGDTSLNGFNTVDSWGVNRFGQNFTTYYTSPIVSDTYCGLWRPNSGVLIHHLPSADYTLTLGVNTNGTPMPTGQCGYGYKVSWTTTNGTPASVILSY